VELPHEPAEQGDAANGPPFAQTEVMDQDAPAAVAEHDPKTEHPVVSAFHRAVAEVPAYKCLLREAGVEPAQVRDVQDFRRIVPLTEKANTFERFTLPDLCRGGNLGKLAAVLTSSGHSGRFAFGLYDEPSTEGAVQRIDEALDAFFQVRSKPSLLINCLPMGVKVYTRACTLAETSVREDMVTALVKTFGPCYEQIILVGETAFIKRVLELGGSQGIHWRTLLTQVIVGEEPLAENARIYLENLLGINPGRPETGTVISSMGVAELGLNLFFETRPIGALRRVLHLDESLRQAVLGPGVRHVPMLFTYDPARIFLEVIDDHKMVVSTLDPSRHIPLMRYVTGDEGERLLPSDSVKAAAAKAGVSPDELEATPIVMVHGRGECARAGGKPVYPEQVKEGLYHEADLARQTTANFRLASGPQHATLRIQLLPDAGEPRTLAERFAEAVSHYADAPLRVTCETYADFRNGMSLDYERKFDYLESAGDA